MKKALAAIVLVLIATGCGGGDGTDDASPQAPGAPGESGEPAGDGAQNARPDDVRSAPSGGGVNRPIDGTYTYSFAGTNTPTTGDPVSAPEDATFTSKVSNDGDELTTVEQTSLGRSTSTTVYRWTDDEVAELSLETKSSAGTNGCKMADPIVVLRIPVKEGAYDEQTYEGEGGACNRTKTVKVVGRETISDAEGRSWSTWLIEVKTVHKPVGLIETFDEQRWFSPDLGKDIKTEVKTVGENTNGDQLYNAETSTLLETYPS
jgi:hypothetical protein